MYVVIPIFPHMYHNTYIHDTYIYEVHKNTYKIFVTWYVHKKKRKLNGNGNAKEQQGFRTFFFSLWYKLSGSIVEIIVSHGPLMV